MTPYAVYAPLFSGLWPPTISPDIQYLFYYVIVTNFQPTFEKTCLFIPTFYRNLYQITNLIKLRRNSYKTCPKQDPVTPKHSLKFRLLNNNFTVISISITQCLILNIECYTHFLFTTLYLQL